MLEHIEHEHQRVASAGLEGRVEWRDVNAVAMRAVGGDDALRRLHPLDELDAIERGEPIEEQPIAAADVQHGAPALRRAMFLERAQDDPLARAPPPVALEKLAVPGAV